MTNTSLELLDAYSNITFFDFEFRSIGGNLPVPVCMVTKDARTGVVKRYWQDDLRRRTHAPFPAGPNDLVVAFYASAEFGCMLELGWDISAVNVIDLFAENRVETNGLRLQAGNSFLGALAWRGLTRIDVAVKDAMRDLILGQSSWSPGQQTEILDYCTSDVEGLDVLLRAMLPKLDLPRALLRGRYTKAVARMERAGIPIDAGALKVLVAKWKGIRRELVKHIDQDYSVYQGETFKLGRFVEYLRRKKIPWNRRSAFLNERRSLDGSACAARCGRSRATWDGPRQPSAVKSSAMAERIVIGLRGPIRPPGTGRGVQSFASWLAVRS